MLWGSGREAALAVGPPLSPHLNEASETELFFLGPFSPPPFSFAPMFVGVLIKVFDSLKCCN